VQDPTVDVCMKLSDAVAASAAYPPVLSPFGLSIDHTKGWQNPPLPLSVQPEANPDKAAAAPSDVSASAPPSAAAATAVPPRSHHARTLSASAQAILSEGCGLAQLRLQDPDSWLKQMATYRSRLSLADGGVYDNLGLETAWRHARTILVSDAGALLTAEPLPSTDWVLHSLRVAELLDNQVFFP
jgi:hypothetical protein